MLSQADINHLRALVGNLPDPEIPVLTLDDLGMVRACYSDEAGNPVVHVTPTYSGCPATEFIMNQVQQTLVDAGFAQSKVKIVLDPAWTTDWIGPEAAQKLKEYGIAAPGCTARQAQQAQQAQHVLFRPRCPRCNSLSTEELSQFGSTPCKSLYRCISCREPFDYFKPF